MSAHVFIVGNIGSDPENGVTPNGAENVKFRVASNDRRGQNETTTWFSVTVWGAQAKGLTTLIERGSLGKGSKVAVIGKLIGRTYQDRNGVERMSLDVDATSVEPLSWSQPQDNAASQNIPF